MCTFFDPHIVPLDGFCTALAGIIGWIGLRCGAMGAGPGCFGTMRRFGTDVSLPALFGGTLGRTFGVAMLLFWIVRVAVLAEAEAEAEAEDVEAALGLGTHFGWTL